MQKVEIDNFTGRRQEACAFVDSDTKRFLGQRRDALLGRAGNQLEPVDDARRRECAIGFGTGGRSNFHRHPQLCRFEGVRTAARKTCRAFLFAFQERERRDRDKQRAILFVIIAENSLDKATLAHLTDRLNRATCFAGPDNNSWPGAYLDSVAVFNEATWNEKTDPMSSKKKNAMKPLGRGGTIKCRTLSTG